MTDGEQEQFNTIDDTDINGLVTVPAEQARAESDGGLSPGRPLALSSLVALTACGGGVEEAGGHVGANHRPMGSAHGRWKGLRISAP